MPEEEEREEEEEKTIQKISRLTLFETQTKMLSK